MNKTKSVCDPIAIIGSACRFPGKVIDLDSYWQLLSAGKCAIKTIPDSRWVQEDIYSCEPQAGKSYAAKAGLLESVDRFDADFLR
ncbi:hypothetical protein A8L45_06555 [Veronia pacifica]|uniref:Beta-ketoacyl synthase-like N-terminal domain-containing protein n=1 Tax=Veronia pacifica TaxID=1080227 RepID=A0A1C3EMB8_9GAMM|nr:hypothetical protein A8L45_06555 [Veronia pacifica]